MSDRIRLPYFFDSEEQKLIDDYYTNNGHNWKDKRLTPVKDNLKRFLRFVQNNKCCYCQQELGFDNQEVNIEHIVDKNKHKAFGFLAKNLALSCPACNSCKGDREVLENSGAPLYPDNSLGFKIVHPHYDYYSEHIECVNYPVFKSLSKKGTFTINTCKLNRFETIEQRQKEHYYKTKIINSILNSGLVEKDQKEAFAAIKKVLCENDDD